MNQKRNYTREPYSPEKESFVRKKIAKGQSITAAVKQMCRKYGLEYNESMSRNYRQIISKTNPEPKIKESEHFQKARERKYDKNKQYFLITWAQNATPVHKQFFENMKAYASFLGADLHVIAGRYKNPTSVFVDAKEDHWADEVLPYLDAGRHRLHKYMMVLSDIKTQPTAVNPLSGMQGITGLESCIIGHPKIALQSVPVLDGYPNKLLLSTGACTVPNYTDSAAGAKGEFHHQNGFVIVEIQDRDVFHVRQVSATRDGSFCDLWYNVSSGTVGVHDEVTAFVCGDLHAGDEDPQALAATFDMLKKLKPSVTILHDVFNGASVSHHELKDPFKLLQREYDGSASLSGEIQEMLKLVSRFLPYNPVVVAANHNDFLDRWLRSTDWRNSPNKADYLKYAAVVAAGEAPNGIVAYELEKAFAGYLSTTNYNESFRVGDWELGQHGDKGANGSKGTPNQYKYFNTKMVTGHSHTPTRQLGFLSVGTLTKLRLDYNIGASSWMHSNVVIYPNGKASHIHIVNGKYTTIDHPNGQ